MQRCLLAGVSFALCCVLHAPAQAGKSTERLGTDVVPTHQEISLALDPDASEYRGAVRIELDVRAPTDVIRLHAEGLTISSVSFDEPRPRFDGAPDAPGLPLAFEMEADDVLRVTAPRTLAPGDAPALIIEFRGRYGTRSTGLYRVEQGADAYLFTQFEADDARQAFPCFDEPSFKIPFDVTLDFPEGCTAITNTPPETQVVLANGPQRTKFQRTEPIPTYLVAFAVGPLEQVPIPGTSVPARVITPRGQSGLAGLAQETTPPILAALEKWFDAKHPYPKLDLIAVPEFWPGAMENAGAITYRDRILLVDPAQASAQERRRQASVTAHELAHQWFGNFVTMHWWDDLWLNEAFADWLGNKITEQVYPELRQQMLELQSAQQRMADDARPSTRPIRHPVQTEKLMDGVGLAYAKGRTVLGMFEGWLGEESFRRGVLNYLEANAWGNAEAADLWAALDATSGTDVSGAMAGFLDQPGFPLIRVQLAGEGRVRVSQRRFRNHGVELPEIEWRVPIVIRWADAKGTHAQRVMLDAPSKEFDLDAKGAIEWLYPNGGGSGYYRWWMEPERIEDLALRSAHVLQPSERAELLADVGALLDAGELDGEMYLRALAAFRDDPDPLVLSALVSAADKVRDVFVTPEREEDFAAWTRAMFAPGLARLGREPVAGEEPAASMARPGLLEALADWGEDGELRAWARRRVGEYLADPGSVDPSLAGTLLEIAALGGDAELLQTFRTRFEAAASPAERGRFLQGIASFRDPELQDQALAWALHAVRTNELTTFTRALSETEAGREKYFEFTRDHFDELAARYPAEFVAFFANSGGGCSTRRFEEAEAFFGDPERAVPGTELALARVRDAVTDCVGLRAREAEAVDGYLRRFAESERPGP